MSLSEQQSEEERKKGGTKRDIEHKKVKMEKKKAGEMKNGLKNN